MYHHITDTYITLRYGSDETASPVSANGRKMALSAKSAAAAERNGRSVDVEHSSLVTSSAPINTDQRVSRQKHAKPTANVESETRRQDNGGKDSSLSVSVVN